MSKIKVIKKELYHWVISVDGVEKLAIVTNLPGKVFTGKALGVAKSLPGFVSDKSGELSEWHIQGMREVEGQILFWGEKLSLISLKEDSPLSLEELKSMRRLFTALNTHTQNCSFSLDCYYRIEGGGLFSFPPGIMEYIHGLQSLEHRASREAFNHPDLNGEDRLSHSLAVLIFHSATGVFPYSCTQSDEWIHQEIRKKPLPSLATNGIESPDLINGIKRSLKGKDVPSLACWGDILKEMPTLPGSMTSAFQTQFQRNKENFKKSFMGRKNQNRNRFIIIVVALSFYLIYRMISSYLAPPFTNEMGQNEVIDIFYEAVTEMDIMTIGGTTDKKIGESVSNQVGTLYVIEKSRQSVSSGGTVTPTEWREREFAPLPKGVNIYGIENLTIESLGSDTYRAKYYIWYPPVESWDNLKTIDPYDIRYVEEKLFLVRDKRDRSWIIGDIIQEESQKIPSATYLGE